MFLTIFLGIILIGCLYIAKYLTANRGVVENFGIPYIKPFLIFGSPPFLYHKFIFSDWMINQFKKLGRTWARYDGRTPVIVTIDPEFIKQVTVKQFDNFTDTFDFPGMKDDEMTLDIATGEKWRTLRKILSPTFTTGKMKGMLEPINELADRTIEYMAEKISTTNTELLDVKPIIQGFTLDAISKCAFGLETTCYKGENNDFAKISKDVIEAFRATGWIGTIFFNLFSHFPIIIKYTGIWQESAYKIRKITHDIIEERVKNNIETGDFIDRLKEHKANLVPPLTPGMMDAQGMVFLIAGYETTANTLGSAVFLLANNPDVQDELFEEITAVCESSNKINHETIKDMHLLEAAIKETLRLRPPVTEHDRVCMKDCEVNGIKIPAKTRIQMPNLPAHLDEEFFPEPLSFNPRRFLKENADQIIDFTWRPFGSGNRVCIGQRFSITEMMIFLAKFVTTFRVTAIPETKSEYYKGDLFMNVAQDVTVKLEKRE